MQAIPIRVREAGELKLRALLLGCLLGWSSCCGAAVQAQGSADEPPTYRPLVDEALAEYDAHNFAEARTLFARAHGVFPNARTLRGQGMAEFELRNYADAIAFLEQALRESRKALTGTLRRDTEELLQRAQTFVVQVELSLDPPGTTVIVDGVAASVSGASSRLTLKVGDHLLEFRAAGYTPERRELKITGGEHVALQVTLLKIPIVPAPGPVAAAPTEAPAATHRPDSEPPLRAERRPVYKNPWLWTGVGVVVAGAAAGTAVALASDRTTQASPAAVSTGMRIHGL